MGVENGDPSVPCIPNRNHSAGGEPHPIDIGEFSGSLPEAAEPFLKRPVRLEDSKLENPWSANTTSPSGRKRADAMDLNK
jgi:hypothetical protein